MLQGSVKKPRIGDQDSVPRKDHHHALQVFRQRDAGQLGKTSAGQLCAGCFGISDKSLREFVWLGRGLPVFRMVAPQVQGESLHSLLHPTRCRRKPGNAVFDQLNICWGRAKADNLAWLQGDFQT